MDLEYRDNIDYSSSSDPLNAMLDEIIEMTGRDADASALYDAIRERVMRDIRMGEMAITVIMPDLIEMTEAAPRKAMLVMRLLADPYASYSELGREMGYSKQRTAYILGELAGKYGWLRRLLDLHNQ